MLKKLWIILMIQRTSIRIIITQGYLNYQWKYIVFISIKYLDDDLWNMMIILFDDSIIVKNKIT